MAARYGQQHLTTTDSGARTPSGARQCAARPAELPPPSQRILSPPARRAAGPRCGRERRPPRSETSSSDWTSHFADANGVPMSTGKIPVVVGTALVIAMLATGCSLSTSPTAATATPASDAVSAAGSSTAPALQSTSVSASSASCRDVPGRVTPATLEKAADEADRARKKGETRKDKTGRTPGRPGTGGTATCPTPAQAPAENRPAPALQGRADQQDPSGRRRCSCPIPGTALRSGRRQISARAKTPGVTPYVRWNQRPKWAWSAKPASAATAAGAVPAASSVRAWRSRSWRW